MFQATSIVSSPQFSLVFVRQKKRDEDIARQQLEEKIASNKTKWLEEVRVHTDVDLR